MMKTRTVVLGMVLFLAACISHPEPWVPKGDVGDAGKDAVKADGQGEIGSGDAVDPNCTPKCDGKECGDDGCGDTCGTCESESKCQEFTCIALPIHVWSVAITGENEETCQDIAVSENGNLLVLGYYDSQSALLRDSQNTVIADTNAGWDDILLTKLNNDGEHQWSKAFGSEDADIPYGVGLDSEESIYLVGNFGEYGDTGLDFGNGKLENSGDNDVFFAKINPSGNTEWSKSFGGSGQDFGSGIFVLPNGNFYVTGYFFSNQIDFGAEILDNKGGECGDSGCSDLYISKFDTSGKAIWSRSFGGHSHDYGTVVEVSSDGSVFIGGYTSSNDFEIADKKLENFGQFDFLVIKISPEGDPVWAKAFGGEGDDLLQDMAVSQDGELLAIGSYKSPAMKLGKTVLENSGGEDIYLIKLDSDGTLLLSKSFGNDGRDTGYAVTSDSTGAIYITGFFESFTINFGGANLVNNGDKDIYLAKFTSEGNHIWSRNYGGSQGELATSLALDKANNLHLCGSFRSQSLDFSGSPLEKAGDNNWSDAFVVMLSQ
jgi:hypothetical protein